MTVSTATPFDFSRLESVSLQKLKLTETLQNYLPSEQARDQLRRGIEQTLQQSIRGGCTLHPKGFHLEDAEAWRKQTPNRAIYVVLTAAPTGPKALMVWDPVLVLALIDRLLAGELAEIPTARSLSEIETGVFSYLMTKILQVFHEFLAEGSAPLRLQSVEMDRESIMSCLEGAEQLAISDVVMAIPELTGVVQLILPDSFISNLLGAPRAESADKEKERVQMEEKLRMIGDLSFPLIASIGETKLTPSEMGSLEPGDIVLVDTPHCRLEEGSLNGDIVFHPTRQGAPTIVTKILESGPPARVEIKEIFREA